MAENDAAEDRRRAEVFDALSHPTRILILKALNEGPMGFADIKKKLGIESSGHLQHHLSKLGALVKTDEYGKYGLSDAGKDALLSVETVEKVTGAEPKEKHVRFNHGVFLKSAVIALILLLVATSALAAFEYSQTASLQNSLDERNNLISQLKYEQTNVPTTVSITETPSAYINVQPVYVQVEINPGPPTASDRFTNFTFTVKLPDGTTVENVSDYPANSPISFALGANIIEDTFNFTNATADPVTGVVIFTGEVGAYTLTVDFLGQTFSNGVYYMPSENETSFSVVTLSPAPRLSTTPTPSPN